jgi:hypothetical protein
VYLQMVSTERSRDSARAWAVINLLSSGIISPPVLLYSAGQSKTTNINNYQLRSA